jgi:hypothetical protein
MTAHTGAQVMALSIHSRKALANPYLRTHEAAWRTWPCSRRRRAHSAYGGGCTLFFPLTMTFTEKVVLIVDFLTE